MENKSFTQKVFTTVGIVVAIVLAILLVIYAVDELLLAFAGILLAVFFRGLADWLAERTGLGRGLSFVAVILTLLIVFGVAIYFLEQSVVAQVQELREQLPESFNSLRGRLEQTDWGKTVLQQIPSTEQITETLRNANFTTRATGFLSTTFGVFINFFIFLVLGIFIAIEPETYVRGVLVLVPQARRERIRQVLDALGETLRWWLVGKFASMLAIGTLTWIGLSILDVPLALTLGIITALLTFIPNIGPVVSLIPAALLALAQDPIKAVYVVILYVGVQIIESNLITPFIERRTVELPPALTVGVQLILSVFVGSLGLVLAAPLIAAGIVLVQMLYIEDILGEKVRTADEKNKNEFVEKQEATVGVEKIKGNQPERVNRKS